MVALNVVLLMC